MSRPNTAPVVARFAAAGLINTALDYGCFLLLSSLLQLPVDRSWIAKVISGAVAMTNSFALNRAWVFRAAAGGAHQVGRFIAVTMFGTFVVQLGGTYLFSAAWPGLGELCAQVVSWIGIDQLAPGLVTRDLVIRTTAFALGTGASMCWNFTAYRRWVFTPRGELTAVHQETLGSSRVRVTADC